MMKPNYWVVSYLLLSVLWLVFAATSQEGLLVRAGWAVGGVVFLAFAAYVRRTGRHPIRGRGQGRSDGDG
jgi:hypothetical protein